MSELKAHRILGMDEHCASVDNDYYLKSEADKVIAEKDAEITDLKKQLHDLCAQSMDVSGKTIDKVSELMAENDMLKKEISDITDGFCDSTHTHIKELRATRRALWLARAKRANESHFMWCQLIYDKKYGVVKFNVRKEWGQNIKKGQTLHTPQGWADVWDDVERKCRAKAEQMSELKAIDDLYERRIRNGSDPYKIKLVDVRHPPVYLKSEADAVIAEKDAKILALDAEVFKQKHHAKLFFDERNYAEIQLRHYKRKRCLAMARCCFNEGKGTLTVYEVRTFYWARWGNIWLELAEKFKEA